MPRAGSLRRHERYGALPVVSHVSFTVKPGEVLGYLGPNGSGKSTTVEMLTGLMPPTTGHILFDGADIQKDLVAHKARVGYVPEEAHVYTYLTGPEYLRLCGRLRGVPAAALERKIDRFLHLFGLDVDYHATLSSFSKGMRQKILLSAALIHNPRLIILDEPVSGLDVGTALVRAALSQPVGLARCALAHRCFNRHGRPVGAARPLAIPNAAMRSFVGTAWRDLGPILLGAPGRVSAFYRRCTLAGTPSGRAHGGGRCLRGRGPCRSRCRAGVVSEAADL